MCSPVFSVVIPAFNAEATISASIKSVLGQTFDDLEVIVVDDCSSDGTVGVIESLQYDPRVKFFSLSENLGIAGARNKGIEKALGRYIAFLDSDDKWLSEKLAKQVAFMAHSGAAISCTGYCVVNELDDQIGVFHPLYKTSYQTLLRHNTVGCSTVVIDTKKVEKFKFPACGHEDYALWLELARRGFDIFGLNEELGVYKVAAGSASANKVKVLAFFWNIYKSREGFSRIKSFFYCLRYAWNVRRKYK